MSIRLYKSYTPGTRNRALSAFSEITKSKPEKRKGPEKNKTIEQSNAHEESKTTAEAKAPEENKTQDTPDEPSQAPNLSYLENPETL